MTKELLAIDVASELRSLCEAQLRGTWQVPAEILRLAFRIGAQQASVDRRFRSFVIRWPDAAFDEETLQTLCRALDSTSTSSVRQQAITSIEGAGVEALLWASGLKGAKVKVVSRQGNRRLVLRCRDGRRPRLSREHCASNGDGSEVHWTCAGLHSGRAESWLRSAVRFADQTVKVNGVDVPRGFSGGLFHVRVDHPIPARLGLTRSGDEPVLWLLKNGVVAARAGLPGYPPFEAAIEMAGEVPGWASSSDLRRAVSRHLTQLVDRVVWMMLEVAGQWPDLEENVRQRLSLLLLMAARRRLRTEEVRKCRIIPTLSGRVMSIAEVEDLARERGGVLPAVDRVGDHSRSSPDLDPTLCLAGEARSLLAEILDIRFFSPAGRRRRRIDRCLLALRSWHHSSMSRVRGFFAPTPIAEEDLSPRERRTLALIRLALDPLDAVLQPGSGPAAKQSQRVTLGRENSTLVDASQVLAREPEWVYPVILAMGLKEGSPELQRRWRQAVDGTD